MWISTTPKINAPETKIINNSKKIVETRRLPIKVTENEIGEEVSIGTIAKSNGSPILSTANTATPETMPITKSSQIFLEIALF